MSNGVTVPLKYWNNLVLPGETTLGFASISPCIQYAMYCLDQIAWFSGVRSWRSPGGEKMEIVEVLKDIVCGMKMCRLLREGVGWQDKYERSSI